jgi:membrane fusion protein, macrolide-specific efflux system
MKNKIFVFIVIFLVAILVVGFAFKDKLFDKKNGNGQVVEQVTVEKGVIRTFIAATGTVKPRSRLEILPAMAGRVEKILVKEGDVVSKGQCLALMSSVERASLLDAARSRGQVEFERWRDIYKPIRVISPIAGELIVRNIEEGQIINALEVIFVVSDYLIVKALVDETDVASVKIGREALINVDAYPDVEIKGVVEHISYEAILINQVTMYEVDMKIDNIPDFLRSGMSSTVTILDQYKKNVLKIPVGFVKEEKGKYFVIILEDEEYRKQYIELGISDGDDVAVYSGLNDKNVIVNANLSDLKIEKNNNNKNNNPLIPSFRRRKRAHRKK